MDSSGSRRKGIRVENKVRSLKNRITESSEIESKKIIIIVSWTIDLMMINLIGIDYTSGEI